MKYCKFCGSRIDDDSVFCSRCGKRLTGSAQSEQPPPPKPERPEPKPYQPPEKNVTSGQRAKSYEQQTYKNTAKPDNTAGTGGVPPAKKPPMKLVIPAALLAFIVVTFIISSISGRGGKEIVPTPRPTPTVPIPSISLPPELFNSVTTSPAPRPTPKPTPEPEPEPDEPVMDVGTAVLGVLTAITERPDYIYGDFEPLIGITDVNENGYIEITAVYETKNNGTYEVRYDVWRADSQSSYSLLSDVLFYEVGGNSGVLHMMRDSDGAPYIMLEQNLPAGEYFHTIYDFYKYTGDETELEFYGAWERDGRYDTEHGGIAEENYYMYESDRVQITSGEFKRNFDNYTTVYSLDILSGEYDWDNTLSFDWAWKVFEPVK